MKNKILKAIKERYTCKEFDIEKKIGKEDFIPKSRKKSNLKGAPTGTPFKL